MPQVTLFIEKVNQAVAFFVVKNGSAGLYMEEAAGTPLIEWTKGDHFGEMAFLESANQPTYSGVG